MVEGKHKSRSKRRSHMKTPGGKTKQYYNARRPACPKCAACGEELKGIPRMMRAEAKNAPKSKKTVERPFGGFLCSSCLKAKLKKELRA